MTTSPKLTIGTRGSPLALAQAHEVRDRLLAAHPELSEPGAVDISIVKTLGDQILDRPLSEVGGKGLFTKELDEAMLDGRIDLAVHSMKDVATVLPEGIDLPCILEREDPRDAFMCLKAKSFADLPDGAVVGTSGLRRAAQVLNRYPHLRVESLRGNVQTRMKKLQEGGIDATLLAMAGLNRLGLTHHAAAALEPEDMLPAIGQGAIGVTCRSGDRAAQRYLLPLIHAKTTARVICERAFLAVLDGSCRTPIAGLAEVAGDGRGLRFRGMILRPDGSDRLEVEGSGSVHEAAAIGRAAGEDIRGRAGASFLESLRQTR
jgi:hydroxymethylbilane synthase